MLWVGSLGGIEAELVQRAGLPFKAIHGEGVHGVGRRLPLNTLNLARGFFEALRLVRTFQPNVLLVTGGFITAPVAFAAWLSRVPILVYLPDLEPGLAVRLISRMARKIAVTAAASRRYYDARTVRKVVVTGYPVRPELTKTSRETAIRQLGLDPHRLTVLATGGSRGARSINRAVFAALPDWLGGAGDYQVIHLSGQPDWAEVEQAREALPADQRPYYHAFPFLHEMGPALAAADVVVSRAGASALGEYPLFGLPAILAPYPHAWRYQKVNADYLVERGAAIRVNDEDLPARLISEVRDLLGDEARLARMRAAARTAATPEAARRIAHELVALAAIGPGNRTPETGRGAHR
ncbi:MAG: UDP-N-acetylglucosamine--N-acetylmuramyl-(pentapeptide) pyrophosphoryl-undecaprenol N-acetylglucosamine transferase [Chloroflexi bacterium]|nr:UDP-N-acetylglucosamine--N-acetylmuramyl-(pentapeptide) pyrophosphoryl-undecaprenol N-acetylglucosamine transferase [Chloroflexota bacterium]